MRVLIPVSCLLSPTHIINHQHQINWNILGNLLCSSEFHYSLITMQETLVLLSLIFFLSIFSSDGFVRFTSKIRNESYRRNQVFLRETESRCQPRRWYGGYKTASKRLADIPKKKKMKLDLVANGVTKTVEKKRQETLQHVLTKGESPLRVCVCSIQKAMFVHLIISSKPSYGSSLWTSIQIWK